VKKAAVIYMQDLHGIEYKDVALQEFKKRGIETAFATSFPMSTTDFKALLTEAKNANVDALVAADYPDFAFPLTAQAMELGFNPKAFFITLGPCLPAFRDAFSVKGVEGIMGAGAWNSKTSAGAKKFIEDFQKKYNEEPEYWGTLLYYSSLQFLQQAIEEAGSLSQSKIRDIMASQSYETAMGTIRFDKQFNANHPGEIGQFRT
jgi:branched-chain amino acid transport system substrate-binding protein